LILLPVSRGVYDFKTDKRTDTFNLVTTPVGSTNATVQLLKYIYDNDLSTVEISSNNTADLPLYFSYNGTSRALVIAGLSANSTHSFNVSYDVDALGMPAMITFVNLLPSIWILIWVAFPTAGLIAIWTGRA
jgi:hypothetical protein